MRLPKQLEPLRERRVWICYPMIWNETKHSGVGGYDKPPLNPHPYSDGKLYNGSTDDPASLTTFDEAVALIGAPARVRVKNSDEPVECTVHGVGVALGGTGLFGVDFDNVVEEAGDKVNVTDEVDSMVRLLDTYTEISPSGKGLHVLAFGKLPEDVVKTVRQKPDIWGTNKAEYQLFDAGYLTVTGHYLEGFTLAERTEQVAKLYDDFFREVEPVSTLSAERPTSPPVVSSGGYTFDRWLEDVRRFSDREVLELIFMSGSTGEKVKMLYEGDTSLHNGNHSEADLALCSLLYGFTHDRAMTERFFRASKLYRSKGKSRNYINRTLNRAESRSMQFVGHIVFTDDEKRAYAQKKEAEEMAAITAELARHNSRKTQPAAPRRNNHAGTTPPARHNSRK